MSELPKFQTSVGQETAEDIRLRLIRQLDQISAGLISGCTDGNCLIRKPKGMHTNGGCNCWSDAAYSLKWMVSDIDKLKHGRGRCY